MSRRTLLVVLVVVVVLAAGGFFAYTQLVGGDEPPPVALASAPPAAPSGAPAAPAPASGVAGNYALAADGTSFVGYRVREQLEFLEEPNEAVGRSVAVQGTMTINGAQVDAAQITADMTQLRSDNENRDRAISTNGLQTQQFPQGTFALTAPIALAPEAATGGVVNAQASGDLTVHGVTRPVTVAVQARTLDANTVEVAGSAPVRLTDFGITPPVLGPVVTIQDDATFEFQLRFVRA
jgi:polyisoprenoid-binding protein YceI